MSTYGHIPAIANHHLGWPSEAIEAFRKQLPVTIRAALERTFEYWYATFAKKHFTRQAFSEYPDSYSKNFKRDFQRGQSRGKKWRDLSPHENSLRILEINIRKGRDTDRPLVKTRQLQEAFLAGSYNFTGSNERLKIIWKGLPKYAYMYYPGKFNKQQALVDWNDKEKSDMELVFNMFLTDEIKRLETTGKTSAKSYGQAVL